MDLGQAIVGRRSVREYTDERVDEQTILRLIDAAVAAPSAINQQPWTFTVVRDQALLERLSRAARAHALESLPSGPHSAQLQSMLTGPDVNIFYRAPVLILISGEAPGPWIVEDCAMAAGNLMLAAHDAGLGSCWIGFAQSFLGTAKGKAMLGLPAAWTPVAPIIVGHPKAPTPPAPRKPPQIRWVG
jgi:nitroreductase